jgi:hypothetical protein
MCMPQIGGEVRQEPLYICSFLIPGHQPMDGPRVAQVMETGLIAWTVMAEHCRLRTHPAEDPFGLLAGHGLARPREQKRRLGAVQQGGMSSSH